MTGTDAQIARTLADMTPAERQQMIGMWAEATTERRTVIITGVKKSMVRWTDPGHPQRWGYSPIASTTPLFDLPRAWTPSGEPVPGEWEESTSTPSIRRWCTRWERTPDELGDTNDA